MARIVWQSMLGVNVSARLQHLDVVRQRLAVGAVVVNHPHLHPDRLHKPDGRVVAKPQIPKRIDRF